MKKELTTSILIATALIAIAGGALYFTNHRTKPAEPANRPQPTTQEPSSTPTLPTPPSREDLLAETNKARARAGVGSLAVSATLQQSAQAKCDDMVKRNYFGHTTPDGKEFQTFVEQQGYRYLKAGENLASGHYTAPLVVTDWLNSPKHRENLLNGFYTEVGFGICNSSNFTGRGAEAVIVQHFGRPVR